MIGRRVVGVSSAVGLALSAVVATPGPASAAVETLVTFDGFDAPSGFSETGPLRNQYSAKGVRFRGPNATDGGAVLDKDGGWPVSPVSGENWLAFNPEATMSNGGTPVGPQKMIFDRRQNVVRILVNQSGSDSVVFTLVGKRGDRTVARSVFSTNNANWETLRVSNRRGMSAVVLKTTDSGPWLADNLFFKRN